MLNDFFFRVRCLVSGQLAEGTVEVDMSKNATPDSLKSLFSGISPRGPLFTALLAVFFVPPIAWTQSPDPFCGTVGRVPCRSQAIFRKPG
jgi:hypothetical protein